MSQILGGIIFGGSSGLFRYEIGIEKFSDGGRGNCVQGLGLKYRIDMDDKGSHIGKEKCVGSGQAVLIVYSGSM